VWTNLLEWVKALGVGSLFGVFIGARLTRSAQDRQFARQRAAQRIDRARDIYQEAEVIGHKLSSTLVPVTGKGAQARRADELAVIPKLNEDLLATAVKLRSDGATDVARSFDHARVVARKMYERAMTTADVVTKAEGPAAEEWGWHFNKWEELAFALSQADAYWNSWFAQEESFHRTKRRNWLPWRRRTVTVQVRPSKGDPGTDGE
jgi:hypothetical protein